ncbi:DMT family transporter [Paraperlucidibaca sp.]|uniref:DMT family transporter n=2 Tax=Paraperlucidibaca sp. TaxID=2708021 RepID=UPI0030F407CB
MNIYSAKIIVCTVFALLAFAGNSILCRMALGEGAIDPASFTIIRLFSGIIVLMVAVFCIRKKSESSAVGSWRGAAMLFIYAVTFSYGYVSLDTGTGALILFGSVQITMAIMNIISGGRPSLYEWLGMIVAFSGLAYLVLPGLTTPSIMGFALMAFSGAAWSGYTLIGKGSVDPLRDTAYNFLRTSPLILFFIYFTFESYDVSSNGFLLAVVSGAVTSGMGYLLWYIAIGGLSITKAAAVQLFVPIIAAFGGLVFSNEIITMHLIEASVLILGGVLAVILGSSRSKKDTDKLTRCL